MSWFHVSGVEFQEFSVGGVRTFAIVEGRTGGVPLVLLHGVPGASFVWSTTIQAAGRERRVIVPDLPGWGRSVNRAEPEKTRLSREFLNAWLLGVLESHGIDRCDVMGHGNGAWLALDFLLENSARVRRLGLVNLPLREVKQPRLKLPWARRDWNARRLERWLSGSEQVSKDSRRLAEPLFQELFSASYFPQRSPEFPEGEFRAKIIDYGSALREFGGEVVMMWGKRDSGHDEMLIERLAGKKRTFLFEESAHFPMWDEAEKYKKVVTEFFAA